MTRLSKAILANRLTVIACVGGMLASLVWLPTAQAASEAEPTHAVKKRAVVPKSRVVRTFERNTRQAAAVVSRSHSVRAREAAVPASFGHLAGLQNVQDSLNLKSNAALVVDQETNEVLFKKNESVVLPIASLTKLMTGLLVTEAQLPMDDMVVISSCPFNVTLTFGHC